MFLRPIAQTRCSIVTRARLERDSGYPLLPASGVPSGSVDEDAVDSWPRLGEPDDASRSLDCLWVRPRPRRRPRVAR